MTLRAKHWLSLASSLAVNFALGVAVNRFTADEPGFWWLWLLACAAVVAAQGFLLIGYQTDDEAIVRRYHEKAKLDDEAQVEDKAHRNKVQIKAGQQELEAIERGDLAGVKAWGQVRNREGGE
ncbi:MAG: hypothetical protein H0V89_03860 [Deltaproteobacteria bacterium]|nr:hypothetical protein [Deltaproteobacteria bacterium]